MKAISAVLGDLTGAVAALLANASRAAVWWREVDWRAFAAYSGAGVPAAALGASTLLTIPQRWIEIAMGLFFLAVIPARRWLAKRNLRINLWQLALAGAVVVCAPVAVKVLPAWSVEAVKLFTL